MKLKHKKKVGVIDLVFLYYNKTKQNKILTLVKSMPQLQIIKWSSTATEFDKSIEMKAKILGLNEKEIFQMLKNKLSRILPLAQSSCYCNSIIFKGYSNEKIG